MCDPPLISTTNRGEKNQATKSRESDSNGYEGKYGWNSDGRCLMMSGRLRERAENTNRVLEKVKTRRNSAKKGERAK